MNSFYQAEIMNIQFQFNEDDSYLLATLAETIITSESATEILKRIGEECKKINCQKVLLNELAVEKRDLKNYEIFKISEDVPKVYLAFLCKPELIDISADMLSVFTFTNEYIVKHFSEEELALEWLLSVGNGEERNGRG